MENIRIKKSTTEHIRKKKGLENVREDPRMYQKKEGFRENVRESDGTYWNK